MTDLLDELQTQHQDLRLALRVLRTLGERVEHGASPPLADSTLVLRYLREFAFGVHMPLEARTVLASVSAHGAEHEVECIGQVMRTQNEAQELLDCLGALWESGDALTSAERRSLGATVRALGRTLERCLKLEEERVFAAAAQAPGDDRLGWAGAAGEAHDDAGAWRRRLRAVASRWV